MNEITFPIQPIRTLVIASILAILIAVVLFVVAVLPAEYNLDPTGLGKRLGLTELSDPVQKQPLVSDAKTGYQRDETEILVPAKDELEYKFYLPESSKLAYEWRSDGAKIYSDFHGEPEGDTTGYYESYAIATTNQMNGTITVPYAGSHGWYWKNTSDQPVTITLITSGGYQLIGLKP